MKITQQKWFKPAMWTGGILVTGVAAFFIGKKIKKIIQKKNDEKMLMESQAASKNYSPAPTSSQSDAPKPTANTTKGVIVIDYNNVIVDGTKIAINTTGVEKLQKHFSKNATAKKMIDANGGIDGKMGATFQKLLDTYLNTYRTMSMNVLNAVKQLFASAGLSSSEFSIK